MALRCRNESLKPSHESTQCMRHFRSTEGQSPHDRGETGVLPGWTLAESNAARTAITLVLALTSAPCFRRKLTIFTFP